MPPAPPRPPGCGAPRAGCRRQLRPRCRRQSGVWKLFLAGSRMAGSSDCVGVVADGLLREKIARGAMATWRVAPPSARHCGARVLPRRWRVNLARHLARFASAQSSRSTVLNLTWAWICFTWAPRLAARASDWPMLGECAGRNTEFIRSAWALAAGTPPARPAAGTSHAAPCTYKENP